MSSGSLYNVSVTVGGEARNAFSIELEYETATFKAGLLQLTFQQIFSSWMQEPTLFHWFENLLNFFHRFPVMAITLSVVASDHANGICF